MHSIDLIAVFFRTKIRCAPSARTPSYCGAKNIYLAALANDRKPQSISHAEYRRIHPRIATGFDLQIDGGRTHHSSQRSVFVAASTINAISSTNDTVFQNITGCRSISGGRVSGRLQGTILPGGTDWQTVQGDGSVGIEARYLLELADGARIELQSRGLRANGATACTRAHNAVAKKVARTGI